MSHGEHEKASQNWEGMDGETAWHLIDRHADGWADIGRMMQEWLDANSSKQQRDELLKAAEAAIQCIGEMGPTKARVKTFVMLQDAIASVKGGAA